jgi:hypothetical protein
LLALLFVLEDRDDTFHLNISLCLELHGVRAQKTLLLKGYAFLGYNAVLSFEGELMFRSIIWSPATRSKNKIK